MNDRTVPPSLSDNPSFDRWIRFQENRRVRIATGKVELGQGIVTAIAQIAAEELDVALATIDILSGDSDEGPDELYTTSSLSIEVSGASVRLVCAEARARMFDRLAQRLNCGRDELTVHDGRFYHQGVATEYDYWRLAPEVDLHTPISGQAELKPTSAYRIVGNEVPRTDLPAKVTGPAFVHDLALPGMLHARTLRQPMRGSRLARLDEAAIIKAAGGELTVTRIGDFVAFVSEDETVVHRAATAAPAHAEWTEVRVIGPTESEAGWLVGRPATTRELGAPATEVRSSNTYRASYSRPYIAHASMAPSCAVAQYIDGHLTIWSHGQGMHPLRRTLADALGLEPERISTHHLDGAGCYGHNGADDAAFDAALVARENPGRPIRLMWRREEEFGFEPLGTAMHITLDVDMTPSGYPQRWTTEIWSGAHVQRPAARPGVGGGNLLAAEALPDPAPAPLLMDPPEARGGGATRNAVPLYDVGEHRIVHHLVSDVPVRTSALRGLGAMPNVLAIESMLDELALRIDADPIDYRLTILTDDRARALVQRVATMADWSKRGSSGTGTGLGAAFAQYKNRSAYAAVVAEVSVDEAVRVNKVWCAADAGLVINPDGVRNQLEGGIIQGTSWVLKEQVQFGGSGITSLDWESYPILRFSEVPEIEIELIDRPEHKALGVGECTIGPTAGAIANAVSHALGARVRDLPFTRDRIAKTILG